VAGCRWRMIEADSRWMTCSCLRAWRPVPLLKGWPLPSCPPSGGRGRRRSGEGSRRGTTDRALLPALLRWLKSGRLDRCRSDGLRSPGPVRRRLRRGDSDSRRKRHR
jgi:hypothetical protein